MAQPAHPRGSRALSQAVPTHPSSAKKGEATAIWDHTWLLSSSGLAVRHSPDGFGMKLASGGGFGG
jgi:hypothetical protein